MGTTGLILAAGESRRMGSPKALLRYREESFLDTLTGLFARVCSPVIVVLGAAADRIEAQARRPAVFVRNPHYQRGQTSSMQCGLRAVPPGADGVLFTLVDHPAVAPATLDALLARESSHAGETACATAGTRPPAMVGQAVSPATFPRGSLFQGLSGPLLRVPRHQGRRGHPIWFSRDLIAEFLGLPDNGVAREIVRAHAAQTEFLDIDDPGILADIDDAAAYGRLTGAAL